MSVENGTVMPATPPLSTLEAQDMLTSKMRETEKFEHPNVVDTGKTHMEHENGTDSNKTASIDQIGKQNCLIPLELLKTCVYGAVNVTLSENLTTSNDSHLLLCTVLKENNISNFDCSIPKEWLKDARSSINIKCPVQKEIFKDFIDGCPVIGQPAPRFNCTDKSDENYITSVCTIPTKWLKNQNISTLLNCTKTDGNESSETCFFSAPKKLNCTTNNMTDTICFVSKRLANHNFFSKLNCTNSIDATEETCLFPKKLIQDYNINCSNVQNSTNKICDIPKESFLNDVDKKFNCTSNGENSNQKICTMELNVTKSVNSNTSLTPGSRDQYTCTIAAEWLKPNNTDGSGLNCTTDKADATIAWCTVPSEWMKDKKTNYRYECPVPKNLPQNVKETMLNCTAYYDNSSFVLKCPTSEDNISVPLLENSTTSQLNSSTLSPISSSESSKINNTLNTTNVSTSESSIQNNTQSPLNVSSMPEVPKTQTSNSDETTVFIPSTEKSHITTVSALNTSPDQITKKATEISTPKSMTTIPNSTTFSYSTSIPTPNQTNGSVAAFSLQHPEVTTDTSEQSTAFLRPTESAAILVGVFIAVAALGYVGLLVWRRVLE